MTGRDELLEAMLPHVAFEGWSLAALRASAASLGLSAELAADRFPRGAVDMVAAFSAWADDAMLRAADADGFSERRVRDKVTALVRARLDALAPHREAARAALGVLALPPNLGTGTRLLWRSVDAAWYAAGDRATDWNYYSKRGLLAGVMASTTVYWLDDKSEGSADTWAFLDRRIADVMAVPKATARLKSGLGRLPDPFRAVAAAFRRREL